ncbi:fungal-specific transcription factor domain-containing protein [Podospora fimiseda]|uniref:Fungal-specific transcription factor domain-containing protein n=1 Tax=Podospora fimiseda TaxID=252190 RepID=A0AAN7BNF4_9PEZI|nr:fungal-specific transcription factor domain-containing protein [Podospora fimiseda]
MKNKQKSRSGCRTCKVRRLRCDETKPACRNCALKGFDCPGYQQRLQWSTKHERLPPAATTTAVPENFTKLAQQASASISKSVKTNPPIAATVSPSLATPPPSSSSSSTLSPPPQTEEEPVEDVQRTPTARSTIVRRSSPAQEQPAMMMFQPVVDIPTFLIEHWFKSVCSSWSAFDSPSNPYRRLTSTFWNNSKPVFYALQAISAASLVERLPHVLRETARAAPRKAAEAIQKELMNFSRAPRPCFPSELLLSLFCMSSSMCWLEARQLGQHYVRQARAVLKSLDGWVLDEGSKELVEFFNGCLIYEEMLRSVVSEEEIDFEHMLSWPEPANKAPLLQTTPHAWTGVSADVFRLFGKAMALCRRSRTRWRHNDGTSYRILQGAMKDIEEATSVEESLLAVDLPEPLLPPDETTLTPAQTQERDLYHATQAYRLSSLLQLYETFPDLVAKRMPDLAEADGAVVWNTWVSPLALHIADILGKLPVGSMRCIQPLLCLCAGSGLRYDARVPLGNGPNIYFLSTESTGATALPPSPAADTGSVAGSVDSDFLLVNPAISENAIKISRARAFLLGRLEQLEVSLPPKPIGVAKQLLRAVWSAYDEEIGVTRRTHWLDVMSRTGLHSLFG